MNSAHPWPGFLRVTARFASFRGFLSTLDCIEGWGAWEGGVVGFTQGFERNETGRTFKPTLFITDMNLDSWPDRLQLLKGGSCLETCLVQPDR